jgi:hypothetical protein
MSSAGLVTAIAVRGGVDETERMNPVLSALAPARLALKRVTDCLALPCLAKYDRP